MGELTTCHEQVVTILPVVVALPLACHVWRTFSFSDAIEFGSGAAKDAENPVIKGVVPFMQPLIPRRLLLQASGVLSLVCGKTGGHLR